MPNPIYEDAQHHHMSQSSLHLIQVPRSTVPYTSQVLYMGRHGSSKVNRATETLGPKPY